MKQRFLEELADTGLKAEGGGYGQRMISQWGFASQWSGLWPRAKNNDADGSYCQKLVTQVSGGAFGYPVKMAE